MIYYIAAAAKKTRKLVATKIYAWNEIFSDDAAAGQMRFFHILRVCIKVLYIRLSSRGERNSHLDINTLAVY